MCGLTCWGCVADAASRPTAALLFLGGKSCSEAGDHPLRDVTAYVPSGGHGRGQLLGCLLSPF